MGGRSSSSSASTTNNQDNRIAVQNGIGIGAGGSYFAQDNSSETNVFTDSRSFDYSDQSTTTINTLDGGAIAQAFGFGNNATNRALQTVDLSNAAVGQGFTQLLDAAEGLFNRGESMIGQTQQAVTDAYRNAQTDAKGTIDNRTITVLAVAGVAALFLLNRGK